MSKGAGSPVPEKATNQVAVRRVAARKVVVNKEEHHVVEEEVVAMVMANGERPERGEGAEAIEEEDEAVAGRTSALKEPI